MKIPNDRVEASHGLNQSLYMQAAHGEPKRYSTTSYELWKRRRSREGNGCIDGEFLWGQNSRNLRLDVDHELESPAQKATYTARL